MIVAVTRPKMSANRPAPPSAGERLTSKRTFPDSGASETGRFSGVAPGSSASRVSSELARLTGYRKRRELDASLAQALYSLVNPHHVSVYRPAGEPGGLRWAQHASCSAQGLAEPADSLDIEALPPLDAHPLRQRALAGETVRTSDDAGALTIFPLYSDQEVVGAVEFVATEPLQESATALVLNILKIYSNVHGLLDYSERDTLTGLLNRKTFDVQFFDRAAPPAAVSVANDVRSPTTLGTTWVGIIDVDHFKLVNDHYGHLIGDEVLILLAQLMRKSFRADDGLFRFGGEEFVTLLRNVELTHIHAIFERFRAEVEQARFPQVGSITVSVGFAPVREGDSPTDVIGRADRAVYYAKNHGRNQVRSYVDLVANSDVEGADKVGDIEIF